jgi:hypothetical protein
MGHRFDVIKSSVCAQLKKMSIKAFANARLPSFRIYAYEVNVGTTYL